METVKWTNQKVCDVIKEARQAGKIAAQNKLNELMGIGPAFAVCEKGNIVGTMLDCCGYASLKIKARGKFYLLAKKISNENSQYRFLCGPAYGGGGGLSIFDSTFRQEMSVNIAACRGQAEVLAKHGIEVRVESRID